ncbi:MAG TPA: glycosyltransferase family 87 protein [Chitinophagaceae bacterium]|nr:glycosyltransferase family 87 protein [Chitinophagaceae bacterium]
MRKQILRLFDAPLFRSWTIVHVLYILMVVIASLQQIFGSHNYYDIFRYSIIHLRNEVPLYGLHPTEYGDLFLYGPLFALLFAPFAMVPFWLGWFLWIAFNSWILYYAIRQLNISRQQQLVILFLVAHELLTTIQRGTVNPFITACIILPFVFVERKKEGWASFFIAMGMLMKIYPIVGLACFPFAARKGRFVGTFIGWTVVLAFLPALVTSMPFLLLTYRQWIEQLVAKNDLNVQLSSIQDISIFGLIRKGLQWATMPTMPLLALGAVAMASLYLHIKQFASQWYQLMVLAAVLIFCTIFSTGSESSTYIIAMTGVAIWYVLQPRPVSNLHLFLIIFAFLLISMSPSDLVPPPIKRFIVSKSLKALPAVVIWCYIIFQLHYSAYKNSHSQPTA